ncbi:pyridine nucleotide-disulfide oxidoreductase [Streptococcus pneumoniae]|nr:pyridine nucleotide-disulfide oxidoreductase [Streptococcus pneumoniae]
MYYNIIKDNIVILFVFSHSVSLYKKAIHFELHPKS